MPFIAKVQDNLHYFDPQEQLQLIIDKYSNSEYSDALKLLAQVDVNDSIYQTCYFIETSIYFDQEKYDTTIEMVDNIGVYTKYDLPMRLKKGVALLRLERYEEGKKYFDEMLKVYPENYLVYFNRGIANLKLKDYKSAINDFQETIILNPFFNSAHLELGKICYNEHLLSQAMLCFDSYLLIEPNGEDALDILSLLNRVVSEKNTNEKYGIQVSEDDEAFAEIDLLITNYTALNSKYKTTNDIDLPFVKQNHALMEMLQTFEGNGGFWDKKYVPFYKEIFKSGNFNPFIYNIMSSTTVEKYMKILKKHSKESDDFFKWAGPEWLKHIRTDNQYNGEEGFEYNYYDDGEVSAIGKENEKGEFIDLCDFYYEDGNIKAKGQYSEGLRTGDWIWYHPNGKIDELVSYDENMVTGTNIRYNTKGFIIEKSEYSNGKLNGRQINYNDFGVSNELNNYVDGIASGMGYIYHGLGAGFIATEIPFANDKIDGIARTFYSNGQEKLKVEIRNDIRVGEEFHYYQNGQLTEKYTYVDGEISGEKKKYFDTGQLMEEGQFAKNLQTGEWKSYYSNGNLETIVHYNEKGDYHGVYETYHFNGKLNSRFNYNNGKFISCIYYNAEGDQIKEVKANNKSYQLETYFLNGNLKSMGVYQDKDKKEGEWNFYNYYGQLISKETFENGLITGIDYEYYPDKSLKSTVNYSEGNINGAYKTYYNNGTLQSESFYKDDERERFMYSYFPDGTISDKSYYRHGKIEGFQYDYSVEGGLFTKDYFEKDDHVYTIYYDTAGAEFEKISYYSDSTGTTHYPNGNVRLSFNYKSGIAHGEFIWYYINGQIETIGSIFDGDREGKWLWYNDDGTKYKEGDYIYGLREGEWTTYFENGKPAHIINYFRGNYHGLYRSYSESGFVDYETTYFEGQIQNEAKFYSESGNLQLVRYYDYGILIGYSYPDEKGNPLPMIPLKDGTGKILAHNSSGFKSREFEMYKGEINGEYNTYYDDGSLAEETHYVYGERQGVNEEFYPTGQIKLHANYLNDELNGDWIKYYPSGQVKEKHLYKNGKNTGWSEFFSENGKQKKKIFYFNGQVYDAEYF